MIEGLKPYPEYKNSGLPWLDAIPKHWEMIPNRALMKDQRQVVGERASDYTLLSLTLQGVIARDMVNPKGKFPAQFNTYKVVRPNDMIFCLFDIDETPRGVGLANRGGMITGAYDVFSPASRVDPRFLNHYYRFVDDGKLMKPLYTGLRKTIQRGTFAGLKTPCPSPAEQAAIVRFLDHANRKIDGFIRAKRKLIGLLNEQKQAIIHRAVTGKDEVKRVKDENGNSSFILQPSSLPKKPSGIPWLGDIPRHWEVRRLSSVAQFHSTRAHEQFVDATGTHICVTARFVSTNGAARKFCIQNFSPAMKGDVLMVMSDLPNGRALARAFLVEDDASYAVNQRVCIIRPRKMIPAFLANQANRNWGLLQNDDHYNQTHLSNRDYKTLPLLCPPLPEQEDIVRAVDRTTKHIPALIARTEREISLMQEYRTRLTADVVTGKLDVREAAARLPDEPVGPAEAEVPDIDDIDEGLRQESETEPETEPEH